MATKKSRFGEKFLKNFWRELERDGLGLTALILLIALFLFIFIGQFFVPSDIGTMSSILNANLPPLTNGHILGTTDSGADFILTLIASAKNSSSHKHKYSISFKIHYHIIRLDCNACD